MDKSEKVPKEKNPELDVEGFGYPPDLVKICLDSFYAVVGLRNGQIFEIAEAKPISSEWIKLIANNGDVGMQDASSRFNSMNKVSHFDRGITVRVSEIAWIADCPCGS